MKRFWIAAACFAALSGLTVAQDRESSREDEQRSERRETRSERGRDRSEGYERREREGERYRREQGSRSEQMGDDEIRLRYSDDRNRLSIDVDEDIQFRDDRRRAGQDGDWVRGGELDLRYDTDRHDLRAAGKGAFDVDRAANAMARWWQSWWDEEKTARRSRQQGSESGARLFVRQNDENDDGYLSRRELPEKLRGAFDRVDRDDDGYLSQSELRRYGESMRETAQRRSQERRQVADSSERDGDDQTWAEWWSSWWSDGDRAGQAREQVVNSGAREFIRKYDRNDDGFLVRSELPDRMYDDFDRLDANGDRYVIRSEIEQYAQRAQDRAESRASRSDDRRR